MCDKKFIQQQDERGNVLGELENESLKLQAYDTILLQLLGNIKNKKILDYGGGPGILLGVLQSQGAITKEYDISEEMRQKAGKIIGKHNIFDTTQAIPKKYFDIILCNLVLCIVDEKEVIKILNNIANFLEQNGSVFIGFCNPEIYNIEESQLDLRPKTAYTYDNNHSYIKIKKEGNYKIIENHRPIEWYKKIFRENGFSSIITYFTPEYELQGKKIKDFVIFRLQK